jgi:hypothetical protein
MKQIIKGFPILIALLALFFGPMPVYAQKAHLSDIVVTNTEDQLIVYFNVEDCFTPEMSRAIESGISTTFTFYVNLYKKQDFWLDPVISEVEVQHTVKYDQLKKHYELQLTEIGDEVIILNDKDEVQRVMSEVVALEVASLDQLKKGSQYQIKMMAELEKVRLPLYLHYILFFVSLWDFETDWYSIDFLY